MKRRCFQFAVGMMTLFIGGLAHAQTAPALATPAIPAVPVEPPKLAVAGNSPNPIQMLVPGFTVRELPLRLKNINSLVYAPDGRLFALGYDGNVWQLKDTDWDGLEETATLFYKNESNSIPPSIGMAWGPGGLYIASKRRIIRLRDKGDGTGEWQSVVNGWAPPSILAGSELDAVGIAVDGTGNIYFGLGCDAWMDEYKVNKDSGISGYNIQSARGTIQKISPDWKRRETIATGVRFTVCLAFNGAGDLFCTDQEGATWLPNGNPFDELLNIQPGRHYGFPPRHPRHLPGVIDEPSVFDYAPQHQSTCGLHFNEPFPNTGKIFGPTWWRGDAIVAGESRGKIWRTKLVKTDAGYVAQNQLIACLNMLAVDAIPTPEGDLLVSCHSGAPDWGTGPQGEGRLFKISRARGPMPLPVLVYAASPTETRIVFDDALSAEQWKNLAGQSVITMGKHVTAGDRYESFRPGYQVVQNQLKVPRTEMKVLSASITGYPDTIVLQSVPRTQAVNYAVKLPEGAATNRPVDESKHELPQAAGIDVLTDLTGVETEWRTNGEIGWIGWLPHMDLQVARGFTASSATHQQLFAMLAPKGQILMRTQLDLWSMLHPAVQPGAKLDYEYPPETVTVRFKSNSKLKVDTLGKGEMKRVSDYELTVTIGGKQNDWLPVHLALTTGDQAPELTVTFSTNEDPRERAFPLRRLLLPWAMPYGVEASASGPQEIPEIAGGDWARGKTIFYGQQAACFKCHQVNGDGGKIGPDLSNLSQRDYASVLKDITQPSAAINPDHIAYNVELKDGSFLTGVMLGEAADGITFGQVAGNSVTIAKDKIQSMKASAVSLMPEGLLTHLSAQEQKDLMTFLLTVPLVK